MREELKLEEDVEPFPSSSRPKKKLKIGRPKNVARPAPSPEKRSGKNLLKIGKGGESIASRKNLLRQAFFQLFFCFILCSLLSFPIFELMR